MLGQQGVIDPDIGCDRNADSFLDGLSQIDKMAAGYAHLVSGLAGLVPAGVNAEGVAAGLLE